MQYLKIIRNNKPFQTLTRLMYEEASLTTEEDTAVALLVSQEEQNSEN